MLLPGTVRTKRDYPRVRGPAKHLRIEGTEILPVELFLDPLTLTVQEDEVDSSTAVVLKDDSSFPMNIGISQTPPPIMASCNICRVDDLKTPISLPCMRAVKPPIQFHPCPVCRSLYSVAPISPALIPQQLRLHINPSSRRVFIDSAKSDSSSSMSDTSPTSEDELARLRAENRNLRTQCAMWRRRAELHGAAILGLLDFARVLRDKASSLSRERDELETRCYTLKRQLDEEDYVPEGATSPPAHRNEDFRPSDAAVAALLELSSYGSNPGLIPIGESIPLSSPTSKKRPSLSAPKVDGGHEGNTLPLQKRLRRSDQLGTDSEPPPPQ
ncbi:uncharacterized protein LACBIDRAFT_332902 [Laccaria bicolor S238N-H82]|uniref:Predicted protein n=1 Tax=Laccaria bicolor (strain S238N-H82 / ATCC MYA-4686) TaxID=486041 RepID=B0DU78_LACBS|nr:uncharacterized protein LACBIDRAFT_332902 [Laccaria bicolor S238N-H82]EDR01901.1 predicted protein [Laccaria bicolor S238N-H82]|eukprot:XP_001887511.1 predicted protein [Laccaria bicolor S238N-H82]